MNLHQQFLHLARIKHKINYKLLSLLPEIYSSEIYKQYAHTIEGYAFRFAQIPESVVRKRLNLEKHLEDKPHLKAAIPIVGVHKVAMIATLATSETDAFYADQAIHLSKPALQELSKEIRHKEETKTLSLTLDRQTQKMFSLVQKKYPNLSESEIIKRLLEKELTQTMTEIPVEQSSGITVNRGIPAKLKRETLEKYNYTCAYPSCNKSFDVIHHPERFAQTHSHENLLPLCKTHHEFMHNGLVKNEQKSPYLWELTQNPTLNSSDVLYRKYKQRSP